MKRQSLLCCILLAVATPALLLTAEISTILAAETPQPVSVDTSRTVIISPKPQASSPERGRSSDHGEDVVDEGDGESPLKFMLPIIRELLPHVVRPDRTDSVQSRLRVEVPDVRTMPIEQARQSLEVKGLAAEPVIQGAPGDPADIVITQSPLPRTYLLQGGSVRLEVTSPIILKVPRVIGMPFPEARSIIESAGFAAVPVGDSPASVNAVVQNQDPQPDTGVRKGTSIRLTLGVQTTLSETPRQPPMQRPAAPRQQEPPSNEPQESARATPFSSQTEDQETAVPEQRISRRPSGSNPKVISPAAVIVATVATLAMLGSIILIRRSLRWHQGGTGRETIEIIDRLDPGEQNLQISELPQQHREISVTLHHDKGTQEIHLD